MKSRIELLIDIILDPQAQDHEKDDAAMDLEDFDDDRALEALLVKAENPNKNDEFALESYGETIGTYWIRRNRFPIEIYRSLNSKAKFGVFTSIKESKPEWVSRFNLESEFKL